MKMVKSLLLGTAAGLVAVAGAQAADLPVKAKAVEYVKVCSLYGAGFYYIPGTDTCVKWGGYVRYEAYHNEPGGAYPTTSTAGFFSRTANVWSQHARFRLTSDVRSQTEYGTLRSYFSAGFNWHNSATSEGASGPGAVAFERAFIQFAGFTFGRTESFFAFYNGAAYGLVPTQYDASTGPAGINVAAYTAQFGNGVSATISLEDSQQRSAPVIDGTTATFGISGTTYAAGTNDIAGNKTPDIVGNIRVDQAWGSAQIMGALHQIGGVYWGTGTLSGHPDDKWGWAVGAGMTLKMPWDARDTLSFQVAYAEGASRYVANASGNHLLHKNAGVALGQFSDAVFGTPTGTYDGSLQLTEAWGGTVAFEHYWTPSLRQSVIFAYTNVSYNDTVKNTANILSCPAGTRGTAACDPDWSAWRLGSRVMWNPVANLDVGLEVFYSKINTAYAGATISNPGQGLQGNYTVQDESVWSAAFRVQRSFWP